MTLSATLVQVLADANGDLARRLSTRGRWLRPSPGVALSLPPVGRASGEAGRACHIADVLPALSDPAARPHDGKPFARTDADRAAFDRVNPAFAHLSRTGAGVSLISRAVDVDSVGR